MNWEVETCKNTKELKNRLNNLQGAGFTIFSVVCDPLSGAMRHFANKGKQRYTIVAYRVIL